MKYLNTLIIAFILLFTVSCAEEEFEDLEYNLLADTDIKLFVLESYEKEITPPPYKVNMHFTITNRYNELSEIQKNKITDLQVLSNDNVVAQAAPGATEISVNNIEINFINRCFKFVLFGDGERTETSVDYCFQI